MQDRSPDVMGDEEDRSGDHEVILRNRKNIFIDGVLGVDSFDDRQIILQTRYGTIIVRGEDLHIDEISLNSGKFTCTGTITGIQYASGTQSTTREEGSWFKRLFY